MTDWSSVALRDDHLMMTHELLSSGYDDKAIARMVRSGELHRVRHGAYAFGAHWRDLDESGRRLLMARAVLRSSKAPTVLAGPSAAEVLGAPVWDLGHEVHVARLDAKADRRQAGRIPHCGVLLAEDVTVRRGLPVTSGTKTALDIVTAYDTEHALVVVDGLLGAGETTLPLLERRGRGLAHVPNSLNLPIIVARADGRHESAGESRSDWFLWRHRLPQPIPQFEIVDAWGRVVARVDFAWPELGAFMEFDGKVKYLRHRRPGESVTDAVLREKRREELICGLTGWRCIRIIWSDLYHADRTAARVRATLLGQRWTA
jgi:hypothetical protein